MCRRSSEVFQLHSRQRPDSARPELCQRRPERWSLGLGYQCFTPGLRQLRRSDYSVLLKKLDVSGLTR
jgi:hypothetical protein